MLLSYSIRNSYKPSRMYLMNLVGIRSLVSRSEIMQFNSFTSFGNNCSMNRSKYPPYVFIFLITVQIYIQLYNYATISDAFLKKNRHFLLCVHSEKEKKQITPINIQSIAFFAVNRSQKDKERTSKIKTNHQVGAEVCHFR